MCRMDWAKEEAQKRKFCKARWPYKWKKKLTEFDLIDLWDGLGLGVEDKCYCL